ncbi:MAG: glycosyltransferase family 1 protein [Bacteroidota bacterium]
MRIGIDCINTDPKYAGGVNTFTFGLLDGFSNATTTHTFILFVTKANKSMFEKYKNNPRFKLICVQIKQNLFHKALRLTALFLQNQFIWEKIINFIGKDSVKCINVNCDVLYSANTVLSSYNFNVPTLLSMHDIQQFHYPEFFTKRELLFRNLMYKASARNVTFLQASSEFIKHDLLSHFDNLSKEQITVIREGVDIPVFQKKMILDKDPQTLPELPDRFLFFPAQLWKHKNHITVLKALNVLKERGLEIPLIMTGAKYSAFHEINEYIEVHKLTSVQYLGKVSFPDLIYLYQKAHFFITAVLYESSSLPILEAAASGVPIFASETPPNIEMSSNIRMTLFNPYDFEELANAIESLWDNNEIRKMQIRENEKNVKFYHWDNIALDYIKFLEEKIA